MKLIINISTFIYCLLLSSIIFAQIAPKYSNEFLSIGVGARALGMGNSVTASSSDITSVYWNPSRLNYISDKMEIGAMHSEYFAGIAKYDFIGIGLKIDEKSTAGVSMIRFAVDDIPNTLNLFDNDGNIRYDRISSFSAGDYAFLFSYSRLMPVEGLNIGGNVKLIRRKAGDFASAWGFGFDVSGSYEYENWKFGANIRDITSTFNAWKFNQDELREVFEATGNTVPENGLELTLPRIILGAGYFWNFYKKFSLYSEINLINTTDGKRNAPIKTNLISIDPALGIEIGYNNLVFLRCGVNNIQQIPNVDKEKELSLQPNIGVGINYLGFKLDYAFSNISNSGIGLYSHVFSLSYSFNPPKKANISTPSYSN